MRIYTLLAALTLCAAPLPAQSAAPPAPTPGSRLEPGSTPRLRPASNRVFDPSIATGAVVIAPSRQLAPAVLKTDGSRGYSVVGGVAGFVVGAAAGGALGCLANRDDYGVFCGGQDDTKVFVGAALGAAVGAALGAVIFRHR
ncbi:MAG TPA: hypothetical protein VFH27_06855 [Longimicrobiaceae bacterium]|nr:hypothetical protein [Longimicrobiaceae bacterium]